MGALRSESQQLTGTPNPREGLRGAKGRLAGLRARMDELSAVIEREGGNAEGLAAYRDEFADRSVVDAGDVAGEAAEKAAEAAAGSLLRKGAGRALGLLGLVMDVGEYGGRWALKQGDLAALDEAVEQNRVNLIDLYQVSIGLSAQIDRELANVARMEEIVARDDEIFPELARLHERKRLNETRATRGAVRGRETDPEGDAAEARKWSQDAAKRGVSGVPNLPGRTIDPNLNRGGSNPPKPPPSRY